MESIFATLPCASAFRPCFMSRFVNISMTGSILGGRARGSYPLPASVRVGITGRRKPVVETLLDEDGKGEGVAKMSWRAPKPELEEGDVDWVCSSDRREVVVKG
jgi:hypothetical protein